MASALSCPVCKSSMREVDRDGVTIDVCTNCRGVWLDRGELEKLSSLMDGATRGRGRTDDAPSEYRRYRDDDDDHRFERAPGYGSRDYKKKGKVARLLDFFD